MKRALPPANPDAYVAALDGWRRKCVESLRKAVRAAGPLEETIKWGHLVYFSNGPVLLIRAEEERVLFGFWRGQRLTALEPRLKGGGKYEMATVELREGQSVSPVLARRLAVEAIALNASAGDPTESAKPKPKRKSSPRRKAGRSTTAARGRTRPRRRMAASFTTLLRRPPRTSPSGGEPAA